ncbi:MFS transporter [Streptomyces uncialis]|uniref:Alpha-ketoglutarate permease n=1 Tax=Streptomyces uncialis TaxID=1048205 RepID=A0A1Q4V8I1_9ACTN|nr:MFS transporter [Streptomyces uncialis]OKH94124.1 alpha-ketoglutarate permease [Streptomyces uncialis]
MPTSPHPTAGPAVPRPGFLERQGIVRPLAFGFLAVMLFMVGDGIEVGFLSPYLESRGLSGSEVALLWTVYGFVVAVAAWLSGALAEAWGPRRVMLLGLGIWAVFEVLFLTVGVAAGNYPLMLLTFGIRGLGYPFFAYGFLVWIAMETPGDKLNRAVGWYWFASTMGLGVISSYFAGAVIPVIGEMATLWLSLAFVAAGGLLVIFLVRARVTTAPPDSTKESVAKMFGALTIVRTHPRVGVGGVVRMINTLSFYAFVVFLTSHMVNDVGFSTAQWQTIWGTMLLANVAANLLSGYVAGWIGSVNTVAWAGGLGCFVTVLALYYVPEAVGPSFGITLAVAIVYGLALGAFVPLSAIMPMLAPRHIAASVAILNLGAGLSQFAGSAIAGLVGPIGIEGTVWVIASIYLVGLGLTFFLKEPGTVEDPSPGNAPEPSATDAAALPPTKVAVGARRAD